MFDIDAIRAAYPIAEVIAGAGVALRRSGRRFSGPCPLHRDTSPSLTVYPDTASWYCYGCESGGDVIDFVGRLNGTAFKETASQLARGLAPLPPNVTRLSTRRTPPPLSADDLAVVEAAAAWYARSLTRFADVRAYVTTRGLSLETARALRLGYGAGGLVSSLRRRGLDLAAAQRLGLLNEHGRERFSGRIVVPDLDADGRATWLTGRALLDRRLRYLNLRAPDPLLGLAAVRRAGHRAVIAVEGPFDWLTLREWALPGVALLGTHVSPDALAALATFDEVYLALDADTPGRRATTRIAAALGASARPVTLPMKDVSLLGQREDGRRDFRRALARAHRRGPGAAGVDEIARAA